MRAPIVPGHFIDLMWPPDSWGNVPRRFVATCPYQAFVPSRLADMTVRLDSDAVGAVSEAERAVRDLNSSSHPALAPLARLLLRTESIASSKIKGMQIHVP